MPARCRQLWWSLALALMVVPAWSQIPTNLGITLQYWDFEENTEPWGTLDPQAILGLTSAQENVLAGTSALELQYLFQPVFTGEPSLKGSVNMQLEGGMPGLAAVALGLKTSQPTSVGVGLLRQGGGAYVVPVFSTGTDWHYVVLSLDEFLPGDDLPAATGPLQPAEITGLILIDISQWLAPLVAKLPVTGLSPGPRRLWVDEVRLLATDLPPETVPLPAGSPEPVIIDSCDREAFRFIVLGGEQVKPSLEQAEDGARHYCIDYTLPGGTLFALLRSLRRGSLTGTGSLHLSVRASRALSLVVSVEEKDKSRYDTLVQVEPSDDWTRLDVPYDSLTLADDSTDENSQLDPAQISLFTLADLSALQSLDNLETTLWLEDIYATE